MLGRRLSLAAVACASLAAPAPAAVVVGEPVTLGTATTNVRVVLTGDGAAAYWGRSDGVYVSREQPDRTWTAAARTATGAAADVTVVAGPTGPAGVVVTRKPRPEPDFWTYWLAPPAAGGSPLEPERIPVPAGANLAAARPLALADGTIVFLALRYDFDTHLSALMTFERRPDGSYAEARTLSTIASRATGFQPAGDRLVALFTGYSGSVWTLYVVERRSDGTWEAPQAISEPQDNADNGAATPQLIGGGGSLVAVWNGAPPAQGGFPGFPNAIVATARQADGSWTAPTKLGDGMRPTVAISPNGALGVVWNAFASTGFLGFFTRLAGAPESGADPLPDQESVVERPVGIDDAGHLLILRGGRTDHPRLELDEHVPGRCFVRRAFLTPPDTDTSPVLVVRGDGTGLAAWRETASGTVGAATLAPGPPVADTCASDVTPTPTATPTPSATPYSTPFTLRLVAPRRKVRRRALRRGLRVVMRLSAAAQLQLAVRAPGTGRVGRKALNAPAGRTVARVRLRRAGRRARKLRLSVRARAADGTVLIRRRTVRITGD